MPVSVRVWLICCIREAEGANLKKKILTSPIVAETFDQFSAVGAVRRSACQNRIV